MFNVIILGFASLFTDISSEMVYPLIPLYLTGRLGASPAIVGLIEGIAESLASLLKVFSGYFSDRLGKRKPLTIGGYTFSGLGKIALVFADSWPGVLLGRVADRFGKGIRTAPRDALLAESVDGTTLGRSFGLHRAMDTFGASMGVILSYYFLTVYRGDYRAVFLYAFIPATLGVATLFLVRETNPPLMSSQEKPIALNWGILDQRLKAFLILDFVFTMGNSSNQLLLLRAKSFGFTDASVILLYLVYNLTYSLLSYPAGHLSDKIGRPRLIILGDLSYALAYLGFAVVTNPSGLWLLFGFYGLWSAFTEGVEKALIAEIAPLQQRASLIGLHATLTGIALLPASLIGGLLWNTFGPAAPFYFGAALAALATIGLFFTLRTINPASPV